MVNITDKRIAISEAQFQQLQVLASEAQLDNSKAINYHEYKAQLGAETGVIGVQIRSHEGAYGKFVKTFVNTIIDAKVSSGEMSTSAYQEFDTGLAYHFIDIDIQRMQEIHSQEGGYFLQGTSEFISNEIQHYSDYQFSNGYSFDSWMHPAALTAVFNRQGQEGVTGSLDGMIETLERWNELSSHDKELAINALQLAGDDMLEGLSDSAYNFWDTYFTSLKSENELDESLLKFSSDGNIIGSYAELSNPNFDYLTNALNRVVDVKNTILYTADFLGLDIAKLTTKDENGVVNSHIIRRANTLLEFTNEDSLDEVINYANNSYLFNQFTNNLNPLDGYVFFNDGDTLDLPNNSGGGYSLSGVLSFGANDNIGISDPLNIKELKIIENYANGGGFPDWYEFIPEPVAKPPLVQFTDVNGITETHKGFNGDVDDLTKEALGSDLSVDTSNLEKVTRQFDDGSEHTLVKSGQNVSINGTVDVPADSLIDLALNRIEFVGDFLAEVAEYSAGLVGNNAASIVNQIVNAVLNGEDIDDVIEQIAIQVVAQDAISTLFEALDVDEHLGSALGDQQLAVNVVKSALTTVALTAIVNGKDAGSEDYRQAAESASVATLISEGVKYTGYGALATTVTATTYTPVPVGYHGPPAPNSVTTTNLTAQGAGVVAALTVIASDILFGDGITRQTVKNAAIAGVSAWAGAEVGAAIGSAVFPGFGTLVGAVVGAVLGFIGGSIFNTTGGLFGSRGGERIYNEQTRSHVTQVKEDGTGKIIVGVRDAGALLKVTNTLDNDFIGTSGDDVLVGGDGTNLMDGQAGDDMLEGRDGTDALIGGTGHDHIEAGGGDDYIEGNEGHDRIYGGSGNDTILAGDDSDIVYGGDGIDQIEGEAGDDVIYGDAGADIILGGQGNDLLSGGDGDDMLSGEDGDDLVDGGAGNDELYGDGGNDELLGGDGNDTIRGGSGDDLIVGESGIDILYGDLGEDIIDGGVESDLIFGGLDNDILFGGEDSDHLYGELGNDLLSGDGGDDLLTGGEGSDLYLFRAGDGIDIIEEEEGEELDAIKLLDHNENDLTFAQDGDDLVVSLGSNGDEIRVKNQFISNRVEQLFVAGGYAIDLTSLSFDTQGVASYQLASDISVFEARVNEVEARESHADETMLRAVNEDSSWYDQHYNYDLEDIGIDYEKYNDVQVRHETWKSGRLRSRTYHRYYDYFERNLKGTNGDDRIVGMFWGENIYSYAGNDQVYGNSGNDYISAGIDEDIIFGGSDNDIIYANDGHDLAFGGMGDDTLRGEKGNDTLFGEWGADTLYGGVGDDMLSGGEGGDQLHGEQGHDIVFGDDGNDTITGGDGNDHLYGNEGNDTIHGNEGDDYIDGGDGNDILYGDAGNDILHGGDGSDQLNGGAGDDTLVGGVGADALHGDAGHDIVSYAESDTAVNVNLITQTTTGGHADGDTITNIEGVIGTEFDDVLTGASVGSTLKGGAGDDTITGGAGDDFISGGAGFDTLTAGAGSDMLSYEESLAAVTVDLSTQTVSSGHAEGDVISGFENVTGGKGDDYLVGTIGTNKIIGGAGADTIIGADGSDILDGGEGKDTIVLSGNFVDYQLVQDGNIITVTELTSNQDVITTLNAEILQFADQNITLDMFPAKDAIADIKKNQTASALVADPIHTISLYSAAQHGAVTLNADSTYSYTPNNDYIGDDSFSYSVTNAMGLTTIQTVSVSVGNGGNAVTYLTGTDGNDVLTGQFGEDVLIGGEGNDVLIGDSEVGAEVAVYYPEKAVTHFLGATRYDTISIAAMSEGRALVLWTSDGRDLVYGQVRNADGSAGGEIFELSDEVHDYQQPDIVALKDGGYLAVFGNNSNGEVRAQKFDSEGKKVGDVYDLFTSGQASLTVYNPSITSLPNGQLVAAWRHQEGGSRDIFAALIDYDGEIIDQPFKVNATGLGVGAANPEITGLANGGFVVTWSIKPGSAGAYEIFARQYDAQGNAVTGEFTVSEESGNYYYNELPRIVSLDDGGYMVFWEMRYGNDGNIHGKRFDANGVAQGNEFVVSDPLDSSYDSNLNWKATVTTLKDGGFVLAWTARSFNAAEYNDLDADVDAIRAQIYDGNGNLLRTVNLIEEGITRHASAEIIELDDGGLGVFWQQRNNIQSSEGKVNYTVIPPFTQDDLLIGGAGDDTLQGGLGDDTLKGDAGDDVLIGGAGDDLLIGGEGANNLDGSEGGDTASYEDSNEAVNVDLEAGIGFGGHAEGDVLVNVENLIGSAFDDTLSGDSSDNRLDGGDGEDIATFAGNRADYDLTLQADGSITVSDNNSADGDEGADTLVNIETIQFSDGSVVESEFNPLVDNSIIMPKNEVISSSLATVQSESFTLETQAEHGVVVLGSDGSYSYTPNSNYTGLDSFGYTVTNAVGLKTYQTTYIEITTGGIESVDRSGGDGNDVIYGQYADDVLSGGLGNDVLMGDSDEGYEGQLFDRNVDNVNSYRSFGVASYYNASSIAALGNGRSAVLEIGYREVLDSGSYRNVTSPLIRFYDAEGNPEENAVFIDLDITEDIVKPTLTALDNGNIAVAWYADDGTQGVSTQIFNQQGEKVTQQPVTISNHTDQLNSSFITALDNGSYVVTWMRDSNKDIHARIIDANGNLLSSQIDVSANWPSNAQHEPKVTGLNNGEFLVVWRAKTGSEAYKIHTKHYDASGNVLNSQIITASQSNQDIKNPFVDAFDDGSYILVWEQLINSNQDIYAKRFDANGNALGDSFLINEGFTNGNQLSPSVLTLSDNSFIVTWYSYQSQPSHEEGLYAKHYRSNGSVIDKWVLDDFERGQGGNHSLAELENGSIAILWEAFKGHSDDYAETHYHVLKGLGDSQDDILIGGAGADVLDGGAGEDTASYDGSDAGVTVNLETGNSAGGHAEGDQLINVENLTGSSHNDQLTGDNADNQLLGEAGDDTLTGAGGNDFIDGGAGSDAATFSGAMADFDIHLNKDGEMIVTDTNIADGDEGTDTLKNIENTEFNDGAISKSEFSGKIAGIISVAKNTSITSTLAVAAGETFALTSDATNGAVTLNVDGSYNYVPESGYVGADSFVYSVTNAAGLTAEHQVNLDIRSHAGSYFNADEEFVVNSYTAGAYQEDPAIARLSNGEMAIAWHGTDDNVGQYIAVQRLTEDGIKIGEELRVNTTVGALEFPAIAALSSGKFIVSWTSALPAVDTSEDIRAQIVNNDGTLFGSEFKVNTTIAGFQSNSTIAELNDGNIIIAWDSRSGSGGGGEDAYLQRFDAEGNKIGGEVFVQNAFYNTDKQPDILALNNGGFVMTWSDSNRLVIQFFDANANAIGAQTSLLSGSNDLPSIAELANGNFVIAATSHNRASFSIFDDTGNVILANVIIDQGRATQPLSPKVVALENGNFVIQWVQDINSETERDVVAQLFDASGSALSDVFVINSTTEGHQGDSTYNGDIIALGGNGFMSTWQSENTDGDGWGIAARKFTLASQEILGGSDYNDILSGGIGDDLLAGNAGDDVLTGSGGDDTLNGGTGADILIGDGGEHGQQDLLFNANSLVSSRIESMLTEESHAESTFAALDNGKIFTLIQDQNASNHYRIQGQFLDTDGNLDGTPFTIVNSVTSEIMWPNVVSLANGDFVVAWNNGASVLEAQRFDVNGQPIDSLITISNVGVNAIPELSASPDNGFVVAWHNYGSHDILAKKYDANGNATTSDIDVSTGWAYDQSFVNLTTLNDNSFVVFWTQEQADGTDEAYLQRYDAAGVAQGSATAVTTMVGNKDSSALTTLANGDYIAVWGQQFGPNPSLNHVYMRRYEADGTPVTNAIRVNELYDLYSYSPSVIALPDGGYAIGWSMNTNTGAPDSQSLLLVKQYNADDTAIEEVVVQSNSEGFYGAVTLKLMADGKLAAAWAPESGFVDYYIFDKDPNALPASGNDTLIGGAGADVLDGGAGVDRASYADSTSAVNVNLQSATFTGGDAEGDVLSNIENLTGSDHDDFLKGDDNANVLTGGAGNDTLKGAAGDDVFYGGAGDDVIETADGADTVDGGEGIDQVNYWQSWAAGVHIDLANGTASGGWAEGDTLTNIENIVGSNYYGDTIFGDEQDNIFLGGAGNDILKGEAGNDILKGGLGDDTLTGGEDADHFFIAAEANALETITDFNVLENGEVIDLTAFDITFSNFADVRTAATQNATDVEVNLGGGQVLVLKNVNKDDLSHEHFVGNAGINSSPTTGVGVAAQVADAGVAFSYTLAADAFADADGDSLTYSASLSDDSPLPTWLTFDASTQTFSGIPDFTDIADLQVKVVADDGNTTHSQNFDLDVGLGRMASGLSYGQERTGNAVFSNLNNFVTDAFTIEASFTAFGDHEVTAFSYATQYGTNEILLLDLNNLRVFVKGTSISTGLDFVDGEPHRLSVTWEGSTGALNIYDYDQLVYSATHQPGASITQGGTLSIGQEQDSIAGGYTAYQSFTGVYNSLKVWNTALTAEEVAASSGGGLLLDVGFDEGTGTTLTDAASGNIGQLEGDINWADNLILGSANADTLVGTNNADYIQGLAGDDTLEGGAGADLLDGGDGNDIASYRNSSSAVNVNMSTNVNTGADAEGDTLVDIDWIRGSDFNDTLVADNTGVRLDGYSGDDHISGGTGNDTLIGWNGDDTLIGGAGNDVLQGANGADTLDGGDGEDRADYWNSAAVNVNLTTGIGSGGQAEGDTLVNIENITGSDYNDTLTGDANNNDFAGRAGDDVIYGLAGNDYFEGGTGADYLDGGDGVDAVEYSYSNTAVTVNLASGVASGGSAEGDTLVSIETVYGSPYNDDITGGSASETLQGRDGDDVIYGGDGGDILSGGADDDILDGGAGADALDGGSGWDIASYRNSSAAVNVNMLTNINTGGDAEGDMLSNIYKVLGSDYSDTLSTSNAQDEQLSGFAGNDLLTGGSGNNKLYGGEGNDTLIGGAGADLLDGGGGHNTINGGDGDDIIYSGLGQDKITGGAGADYIDGQGDWDTVYYTSSTSAININLATNINTGGDAEGDTLLNIETLWGSDHDDLIDATSYGMINIHGGLGSDTIFGGDNTGWILGEDGDDIIDGGLGDYNIYGGAGSDTLTGGSGDDTFDFNSFADSDSTASDTITDFVRGEDTIDLVDLASGGITQFSDLTVSNDGTDTFVEANSYDFGIKLSGVLALDETDFDFA